MATLLCRVFLLTAPVETPIKRKHGEQLSWLSNLPIGKLQAAGFLGRQPGGSRNGPVALARVV